MADCIFADDAYLVAAFPGVVQTTAERWAVAVLAAQAGTYTLTMQGADYPYEATAEDDATAIRDGLLAALGAQMAAAVAPAGVNALLLEALQGAIGITVTGPAVDTISATLISGGDGNTAGRAFWLERAKCWLPPCCLITCASDYTLMHAALAAHYIDLFGGGSSTGGGIAGMSGIKSMRLGPASLEAAAKVWAQANPADADLDDKGPGSLYLSIRARYIFGFRCG